MSQLAYFPVKSLADLDALNSDEVLQGYLAALAGRTAWGVSRSFWHGYRNGLVDSGRKPKDKAQAALAAAYVRRGKW